MAEVERSGDGAGSLVIEDDDGFRTEWPWPTDRLLIANADFVDICERQHDALRDVRVGGDQ